MGAKEHTAPASKRYLVVGDIHGCWDEFRDLLNFASPGEDDSIVALGDILDRGPSSPTVFKFFREHPKSVVLHGNHERKHVRVSRGEIAPALSQRLCRRQFAEDTYQDLIHWAKELPAYMDLGAAMLVHGFLLPGIPVEDQDVRVMVGTISGEEMVRREVGEAWWESYDGEKPLIVGHHHYLNTGEPLIHRDYVFAIDTGCCHGMRLTGIWIPSFEIMSVKARRNHWAIAMRDHRHREGDVTPYSFPRSTWKTSMKFTWQRLREASEAMAKEEDGDLTYAQDLSAFIEECDRLMDRLFDHIKAKHKNVIDGLQAELDYASLSVNKQAKLYAERIGRTRLARFLHAERKGEFRREDLPWVLRTPGMLFVALDAAGLTSSEEAPTVYYRKTRMARRERRPTMDPVERAEETYCGQSPPPLEECQRALAECAEAVARIFLAEHGIDFRKASTPAEAKELFGAQMEGLKEDPLATGACMLQGKQFMNAEFLRDTAAILCDIGDGYFYEHEIPSKRNRMDYALYSYQLAIGLDGENEQALWETISVCLQGSPTRPKVALPYAVVLASVDPSRDEVQSILRRI